MYEASGEFTIQDTHRVAASADIQISATSQGMGWSGLYASCQSVRPTGVQFTPIKAHLVILVLEGQVTVSRSMGRSTLRKAVSPGGMMIIPAELDAFDQIDGNTKTLSVYIRDEILQDVCEDYSIQRQNVPILQPKMGLSDPLMEQISLSILETITQKDIHPSMYGDYVSRLFATHLLRKHSNLSNLKPSAASSPSAQQIERAIDFMQANLASPMTLDDISRAAGLSAGNFARQFKVATGATPHKYLLLMRIDRAKRLLGERKSIPEVAQACGFCGDSHLINQFHRFTGETPAAYRRAVAH